MLRKCSRFRDLMYLFLFLITILNNFVLPVFNIIHLMLYSFSNDYKSDLHEQKTRTHLLFWWEDALFAVVRRSYLLQWHSSMIDVKIYCMYQLYLATLARRESLCIQSPYNKGKLLPFKKCSATFYKSVNIGKTIVMIFYWISSRIWTSFEYIVEMKNLKDVTFTNLQILKNTSKIFILGHIFVLMSISEVYIYYMQCKSIEVPLLKLSRARNNRVLSAKTNRVFNDRPLKAYAFAVSYLDSIKRHTLCKRIQPSGRWHDQLLGSE